MTGSQTPLSGRLCPSLRIALLACSLLLCLPLHLLWRLLRLRSPWPPRFLALAAWSIGARVKIVGKPLGHDAFYVSNHLNRSEEHTSELQSLMRISYAVF